MTPKRGRARKLFAKLLLAAVGFLFGGLAAEVALRVSGYSAPDFYTLDDSRGYALRPQTEGWFQREGQTYVRINSDGLRDHEHTLAKPPNVIRIAVLGDSYAEAFSVAPEEAFWSVMAGKLQECDAFRGKQVEVINFGVSGYGTGQELLTLREHVWKYSPDIVMLAVTTNNDVVDNSRLLKKTDKIPYFVYHENQLTLDNSFRHSRAFLGGQSWINRFGRWLRAHSRVVQAAVEGHRGFKVRLTAWRSKPPQPAKATEAKQGGEQQPKRDVLQLAEELGTEHLVYLEPINAVWTDAWRVTESLIAGMRDEVKSHGARFVVVTLSNGPQVYRDPKLREEFKKSLGIGDLLYPDKRIAEFCGREQIPVVTLAPELQAFAETNQAYLHGFGNNLGNGHWNSLGNRVAGELIAKKFCEGGLLQ
ncbi:MAG TPA: SGNH/GDSL hydrolase family protein [Pyrinomonadaceae bacterium]|nr:SGNH/GDSL hydrolase family protein [Pyrinomonadaceae bacterium]